MLVHINHLVNIHLKLLSQNGIQNSEPNKFHEASLLSQNDQFTAVHII